MAETMTDTLSPLDQCGRAMEAAVQASATELGNRPRRVAEALKHLGDYPLYACVLHSPHSVAALDAKGTPQPKWEELLGKLLQDDASPSPGSLPGLPKSVRIIAMPIALTGRRFGALILGSTSDQAHTDASNLRQCALHLALHLYLEEKCGGEEAERIEWLNFVAETTSIVAHEFNNFLNGIMLHLALMKQEAPRQMTPELDVMKRLATDAANLVKKLQQYNSRRRQPLEPTDLNAAIREAIADRALPPGVVELQFDLADGLPRVQANQRELTRLLDLMLKQSGRAMAERPGRVAIRTLAAPRKVILRVEDAGPAIATEALPRLFEPFFVARPGTEEPGLALCHTLARRLHASIRAENRPEGGLAFILEFSPVTPEPHA